MPKLSDTKFFSTPCEALNGFSVTFHLCKYKAHKQTLAFPRPFHTVMLTSDANLMYFYLFEAVYFMFFVNYLFIYFRVLT